MSTGSRRSIVAAALCALLASHSNAQDATCDRACLEGYVDRFLESLVAHDPAQLPLAANVKFTENGQQLQPGQALWANASENSTYRLYFADPQTGQVGFFGVVKENGTPAIISVRLKIDSMQISEIELLVARTDQNSLARLENLVTPRAQFLQPLTAEERRPRAEMIAAADAYFEGLDTLEHGRDVPFDDATCRRMENGAVTANNPDAPAGSMGNLGCRAQFDTGFSVIVTDARERRYVLVDEERGIVFAMVFFDHAGTVREYTMTNGEHRTVTGAFARPMTLMIAEAFQVRSGKIGQIEAVLTQVPYGMPSGWQ